MNKNKPKSNLFFFFSKRTNREDLLVGLFFKKFNVLFDFYFNFFLFRSATTLNLKNFYFFVIYKYNLLIRNILNFKNFYIYLPFNLNIIKFFYINNFFYINSNLNLLTSLNNFNFLKKIKNYKNVFNYSFFFKKNYKCKKKTTKIFSFLLKPNKIDFCKIKKNNYDFLIKKKIYLKKKNIFNTENFFFSTSIFLFKSLNFNNLSKFKLDFSFFDSKVFKIYGGTLLFRDVNFFTFYDFVLKKKTFRNNFLNKILFKKLLNFINIFLNKDNLINFNFDKKFNFNSNKLHFFFNFLRNKFLLKIEKNSNLNSLYKLKSNFFLIKNLSYKNPHHLSNLSNFNTFNYRNFFINKTLLINENYFLFKENFSLEKLSLIFSRPVYLKFFIFFNKFSQNFLIRDLNFLNFKFFNFFKKFFFFNYKNFDLFYNFIANKNFKFTFKKIIKKTFSNQKYNVTITPFFINSLSRFFQNFSGKSVIFKFNPFLNKILTYDERSLCFSWSQKLTNFKKILGPRFFLVESLEIFYLSLKIKDPFILSNWMVNVMYKISFWKYKFFFRYLKYTIRFFFSLVLRTLGVKGIKFQLKGKISVSGNARTRKIIQSYGKVSNSTSDLRPLYSFNLVRSFTGVMGLKVWIFF